MLKKPILLTQWCPVVVCVGAKVAPPLPDVFMKVAFEAEELIVLLGKEQLKNSLRRKGSRRNLSVVGKLCHIPSP